MNKPFECAVCGLVKTKRAAFPWLVAVVMNLYSAGFWFNGPICLDCIPRAATFAGFLLYGLIGLGIVVAAYRFFG